MNTNEALQRFEEIANHYLHELDNFSMDQLKRQPSENEWSLGQMYQHLINSALYMQLRNIEHCIRASDDSIASTAEITKEGAAIFEQGSFPPIRIQVPPSPQYTPEQPESKEQLIQGLNTVIHRMKQIEPTLEKATLQATVSHPRFGALRAKEWFLLIEMHYRHHLLQMDRLKKVLEINV
ncbi:DinB family protein [Paenibacillus radicis (ex Xue et al. 2023)]|uniref:DinB family protein n=1 Tax=Paenibacillus radicis (ex Xue et al. 2023) TaxID=2972489 RepID=A0ABT1YHU3_9BACL|nr:DinB family protein [Paenibacillus radicis (ex Xue et al. 2023)]MCR8632547.1 DinB family protein [Paenibacillus radicis (ex Xue et al. 2023)]